MPLLHNMRSFVRQSCRLAWLACFVLFMMTASPVRSFAQCEGTGAAQAAAVQIAAWDATYVNQLITNLTQIFWPFYLNAMRTQLGQQDEQDWTKLSTALNKFWTEWQSDLKLMTMQLSAGIVDQTQKLGAINDANNILAAAQDHQKEKIRAKFNSQPTDQACRFDTNADYLARNRAAADALEKGFEWDFVSVANNEQGSIAQDGPGNLQNRRWDIYVKNFCDYAAEDCDSGCSPPGGSSGSCSAPQGAPKYANKDIYVSSMLFRNETIPAESHVDLLAMQSMMFNVTGFKVPDPILSGALGTSDGIEQMFTRREYMARMSAVGSMLYSVVSDRIQGVLAPEPSDMRKMVGITYAFNKPSLREIRQSVIEQLWDPNFYKDLGDNPATIAQKELYLKAYGLTMLYEIISKQEKISTAYAIETGAILSGSQQHNNLSSESPTGR